jgi:hypothetical protein
MGAVSCGKTGSNRVIKQFSDYPGLITNDARRSRTAPTKFSITDYAVGDHLAALSGAILSGRLDAPRLGVSLSTTIANTAIDLIIIRRDRHGYEQYDNSSNKNRNQLPHHHLRFLAQALAAKTKCQLYILPHSVRAQRRKILHSEDSTFLSRLNDLIGRQRKIHMLRA